MLGLQVFIWSQFEAFGIFFLGGIAPNKRDGEQGRDYCSVKYMWPPGVNPELPGTQLAEVENIPGGDY